MNMYAPTEFSLSEQAALGFMLANESFWSFMYWLPEGYTIGYGHLIQANETATNKFAKGLTEPEAFEQFREDMRYFDTVIKRTITKPITQAQFDALMSLTANVGHVPSSVADAINTNNYSAAADMFMAYVKGFDGRTWPGLVRRREMERTLFLTGDYPNSGVTREELKQRHLDYVKFHWPDNLGVFHHTTTTQEQKDQAANAYYRMTGDILPGAIISDTYNEQQKDNGQQKDRDFFPDNNGC